VETDRRAATESMLDQEITRTLSTWSQRMSRRSLLGKAGCVVLAGLGIRLTQEATPIFQQVAEASHEPCHHWYLCGFDGRKCACANCSDAYWQCPNCSRVGGSWCGCCTNPDGNKRWVIYTDCYQGDCTDEKFNSCRNSCTSCDSVNGFDPPPYDGTGPWYMCTRVRIQDYGCAGDGYETC